MPPGALAAGLPTGPLHGDEAAAEERLFVKDLGETGSSPTFRIGQVASRAHELKPWNPWRVRREKNRFAEFLDLCQVSKLTED